MKLYIISLIAFIILTNALASPAGGTAPPGEYLKYDAYATMTRTDLEQAMEALEVDHIALQNHIIAIIRSNAPNQEKVAAIHISGMYRLERVAPDLVNIIKFQDEHFEGDNLHHLSTWSLYPAAAALALIGDQAIPAILNTLATSDDIETRRLSAVLLANILDSAPAKVTLQDEIQRQANAKNDAAVARLKAAMPLLDPPQ